MADEEEPATGKGSRTGPEGRPPERDPAAAGQETSPDSGPEPSKPVGEPGEPVAAEESGSTGRPAPGTASAAPVSHGESSQGALRRVIQALAPAERNRFVPGILTVHYAARDVEYPMDGESGLRMLDVLAGTSNDIDPITRDSDAMRAWIMIDRTEMLGAQWTPSEAIVPRRATMDPSGLVDAVA